MIRMTGLLMLLAMFAPQEERKPPAEPKALCGSILKWTALRFVDERRDQNVPQGMLEFQPVHFWTRPYASTDEAKAAAIMVATHGSFGTFYVDGQHNSAYTREFFPPQRVVSAEWEFSCID